MDNSNRTSHLPASSVKAPQRNRTRLNDVEPDTDDETAFGILSRTLMPSTMTRWILPARVRHSRHNNVVFIGVNFVQLYELLPSCMLVKLPVRLDLGCRILSARVLVEQPTNSFLDTVVKQELSDQEAEKPTSTPPHILLLALETCEIAFVFAEETTSGSASFKVAKKKLPTAFSSLGQYGRHMAVNTGSRTLALSPACGQFALIRTKPVSTICSQMASLSSSQPSSFRPIEEQRVIAIDGLILRLEFLLSPQDENQKSVLALLVAGNNATRLYLYTWEDNKSLRYARLESGEPQRLPEPDRLPLMMIPSSQTASFTLVTESGLSVYDDVLSPARRRCHIRIPQIFPPKFVGSSRSPLWVQWAKPPRHSGYRKTNDDFVLVREDGHLEYFEIKHNLPSKLDTRYRVGSLNINVDSAFTILDAPAGYPGDIYIVGGDMNDGAVLAARARNQAESFQVLPNLSPIRDLLVLDSVHPDILGQRIFVSSGKGEGHAAVAEIRQGVEAEIGFEAPPLEIGLATQLWVVPCDIEEGSLTFLLSYPLQTMALRIHFETAVIEGVEEELAEHGLRLSEQTLAYTNTTKNGEVQITPSAIIVLPPESTQSLKQNYLGTSPILIATIHPEGRLLATVEMTDDGFQVATHVIVSLNDTTQVNRMPNEYSTTQEPSSILLLSTNGAQLLIIGTVEGTLDVLKVEDQEGPHLLYSFPMTEAFPRAIPAAICSLVALEKSTSRATAVACGTRSGWVLGFSLHSEPMSSVSRPGIFSDDDHEMKDPPVDCYLRPRFSQQLGSSGVILIRDAVKQTTALALCDLRTSRLQLLDMEEVTKFSLSRIWWTDAAKPDFAQPQASTVAAISKESRNRPNGYDTMLVCVTETGILVASLSSEPSIVPRRIAIAGDPSKLVYCNSTQKLAVAIDQTKLVADQDSWRPAKRVIRPAVQLLDPDAAVGKSSSPPTVLQISKADSRITAMLNWKPTDGITALDLLIIGLRINGVDIACDDGRLIWLKVGKDDNEIQASERNLGRVIQFVGSPIYSLAPYGKTSLIVSAGTEIVLLTIDVRNSRWTRTASYRLPSPAISLQVSSDSIYAATARHSLKMLEFAEHIGFQLRAEDAQTADKVRCTSHFVGSPGGGILATSDNRGSKLLGLSRQRIAGVELKCVFKISVPLMISCLRQRSDHETITVAGKKHYGSTYDGALFEYTVLDSAEWQLLDFIARLTWKKATAASRRHKLRRSCRGRGSSGTQYDVEADRPGIRPSRMHIDGDKMINMLLNSGPSMIRQGIEDETLMDAGGLDDIECLSSDERLKQLSVLVETVCGPAAYGMDPVISVCQWMHDLLDRRA